MKKLAPLLSTAILFSVLFTAVYAAEVEREFKVGLFGSEEVPARNTGAFGDAEVELKDLMLKFEEEVCNIKGVTQAHIHVGALGANGPIVIFLYGFDSTGAFSAEDCKRLSKGIATPANLIPRPAIGINTWDDFVAALLAGNTYVNVHTLAFPGGEIRGQLD